MASDLASVEDTVLTLAIIPLVYGGCLSFHPLVRPITPAKAVQVHSVHHKNIWTALCYFIKMIKKLLSAQLNVLAPAQTLPQ